jgi:co-chaperonin GroES (HSP10)
MIEKHKIRPGMLLVRPSEPPKEQKTASGIIVPVTAAKEQPNGKIVVVGKIMPNNPHDMKIGDLVFYGERAGQEITLYEQKYRLLNSMEVSTWIPKAELTTIN